jgi:hypothetical protein
VRRAGNRSRVNAQLTDADGRPYPGGNFRSRIGGSFLFGSNKHVCPLLFKRKKRAEWQKECGALKKSDFGHVLLSNRVTGAMPGCEKAGPI